MPLARSDHFAPLVWATPNCATSNHTTTFPAPIRGTPTPNRNQFGIGRFPHSMTPRPINIPKRANV